MDRACIWMSAGLVRYKLCDRDFDCERCPLDAALRGEPAGREAHASGDPGFRLAFPGDRRYASGHTWVQDRGAAARMGVDAMAAALLGAPDRVSPAPGGRLAAGSAAATLELPYGTVSLAAPVAGWVRRANDALEDRPSLMVEDPYGAGWLLELEDPDLAGAMLLDGTRGGEQAALDLRHFRRRAALGLLTDADAVGPTMADGGQPLTDLRRMLGPRRYLALVREIVR